jgi:dynein heavy chain 2
MVKTERVVNTLQNGGQQLGTTTRQYPTSRNFRLRTREYSFFEGNLRLHERYEYASHIYLPRQKSRNPTDQKNQIQIVHDLEQCTEDMESILLTKLKPAVITRDNFGNLVRFHTISNSPLNALYQTLHSVFSPVLQKYLRFTRGHKFGVTPKMQALLAELEEGLANTLVHTSGTNQRSNLSLIHSLGDEYDYWATEANRSESKTNRSRASFFRDHLKLVRNDYDRLTHLSFDELLELVERTHDVLDDIWRQNEHEEYPQDRMTHLLDIITSDIASCIQHQLSAFNLMHETYGKVAEPLRGSRQVCDNLITTCDTLTSKIWPHTMTNKWVGPPFTSRLLETLAERLCSIMNIRNAHDLLVQLLSVEEQTESRVAESFDSFNGINPMSCSSYSSMKWKEAVERYKERIVALEKKAALKLKRILGSLHSQPTQLLREFQKYKDVITRKTISEQLESEIDVLVTQLTHSIKAYAKEYEEMLLHSKESAQMNVTPVISNIMWARKVISKLGETDTIINALGITKAKSQSLSGPLFEDLCKYEREQFDIWVEDITKAMNDPNGELILEKTGKLMELNFETGRLEVNYGSQLVSLLREVRQLLSMGFTVPNHIQKIAETGQKFYRHGIVLQQVANFYNTIDQQMLACQQTMLLAPALQFENVVKNPFKGSKTGSVTWDDPKDLEEYVLTLQRAVENLTSANRKLRKAHDIVCESVKRLMDTDLVKNQTKWKDSMNSIRGTINAVIKDGIKEADTLGWRIHWDYQIYKALEFQYKLGLEHLSEELPEMKVELIFKQGKLQFRPSFEEIKSKYYREVKKFINLPNSFKSLGETTIFKKMVDLNSDSLESVYSKAEILFSQILKTQDIFKEWLILGNVDLDAFVDEAISDVADWEMNFRVLKQRGKDAEQLPSSIKVDCITISTVPVKAAIDDHIQRIFDSLVNSLKRAANGHLKEIDLFTNMALEILMKRPQTMAEIGHANSVHAELTKNRVAIQSHFDQAEQKNKLLRSVSGNGVDTSHAKAKWNKLELMLESHEMMIKEQVDLLRGAIDSRIQKFNGEVEKFSLRWQQLKPKPSDFADIAATSKAIDFIGEKTIEFAELEKEMSEIVKDCDHFEIDSPEFTEMKALKSDLENSQQAWGLCQEYSAGIQELAKSDWITIRTKSHLLEEHLEKWSERLRTRDIDSLSTTILQDIDTYREFLPQIKFIRGDSWQPEHWGEFFRLTSIKGITLAELTFGHLINARNAISKHISSIIELNGRADGEVAIREAIQELDMWGASSVFSLLDYVDGHQEVVKIIKEWKETLTQVGDNQSLLQSLKDSPYFKHFADRAAVWEQKLFETDEYLRQLNSIQRKWVYLEPIFSRGALPSEQPRFERINEDFRSIMSSISKDPRVVSIAAFPGIRNTLATMTDQLDRCQKALNEFLEEKRSKFARFYFIGDDDLLEILGQSKNPEVIQAHLKKLFAGVHSVMFSEDGSKLIAMKSLHGEIVKLKTPVAISNEVEVWLDLFTKEMKRTLQQLLLESLEDSNVLMYPCQVVCLTEYLHFTANVEKQLKAGGDLDQLQSALRSKLETFTNFDYAQIQDKQDKITTEMKLKSLILDIIHYIDVLDQLKKSNCKSVDDWEWQKQIRLYLNGSRQCIIRMHDAEFNYTYEYQGIPAKLVHTPLTDKCYLTLTQAMSSGFGGNPFGPAGTGKTESVKALGVLFGRQVLVFNCDEGIDYKSMGRIFVGLVKCGAWGCFDEFNRLEEAVLSAVSQQIQVIQAGLKRKEKSISLLGKQIDLDHDSGIFVTLNPAGKGYGGRQKLPDNLKQLFRSVAMTHPDLDLIAETILLSEGFKQGKALGSKVVAIFSLCKQFLTPQQHYDWGLRPMKAVLNLAGQLMQAEKKNGNSSIDEVSIVVNALCASTISKLTFGDTQKFTLLLKDLFPNTDIQQLQYEQLKHAVQEAYKELDLVYMETQCEKVFQMYESCRQRMGVVLVGPSGSGKTTIWRVLERALTKLGKRLIVHRANPKAVERKVLLGHMDMDTREWSDGIITFASRQAVKEPLENHSWIICDGDVDPEWVESLNSVLDDNRLLTMPNGERIQFGPNVNFIFETHNLKFASPATVSRMGMIYLSDESIDIRLIVKRWLSEVPEQNRRRLEQWTDDYLFQSIDVALEEYEKVVETTKMGLLQCCFTHIGTAPDKLSFLSGLIKSLGSNLYTDQRIKFANQILSLANVNSPDPKRSIDYFVKDGSFEPYQRIEANIPGHHLIHEIDSLPIIETSDLRRNVDSILPWLQNHEPVIVVGPEGCGKSTTLRYCFSRLKNTTFAVMNCSSETRASQILARLNQLCMSSTTNSGRVIRPKDTERLVLYFKDINLPVPDKYETVELIQFLQQLLVYKGFFDSNLEWISVENVQIVASMNPSTTIGRFSLSTRFTSIVRIHYMDYADQEQLSYIYRSFLGPVLDFCTPNHRVWSLPKNVANLANTIISVFDQTRKRFSVDSYSHYLFTPRDISRLVAGLKRYRFTQESETEVLEVIGYEIQRIFQDRLVGNESKVKFSTILLNSVRADWNHQIDLNGMIFAPQNHKKSLSTVSMSQLFQKQSFGEYQTFVANQISQYERELQELNLQLFPEMLEQIARTQRILSQDGGSILLAGRPGIPFYKIIALNAFILDYKVISPKVSKHYSKKNLFADLKLALQTTGIDDQHAILLIEDYQLIQDSFLEPINGLLSGPEIGGIYTPEELDVVFQSLKDVHSQVGFIGSLYEFFVSRIRKNLHVALIFDCATANFARRCQSNPALYTRCQLQWVDNWSKESMFEMMSESFKRPILAEIRQKEGIMSSMYSIHQANVQATPKHFMEFLKVYGRIYECKKAALDKKQAYLAGGLSKLQDASSYVDKLSNDARIQQKELALKQSQADAALKQITDSMVEAAEQKKEMESLQETLREEEIKIVARKQAVELELAEVEPVIRAAKAAVGEIRAESLSEIRSLRAPPPAIRDVLEAVLRLMGNLDMSWNSMKSFLGQRTVKEEILNFDVRSISRSTREAVAELIRKNQNSFEESVIKRASLAAAPLAMWVKANIQYAIVAEKVAPLEQDLKTLSNSLEESRNRVTKLRDGLQQVDSKVAALKEDFSVRTREAETLKAGLERAMEIMQRAQGLLEKLSGEGQRWSQQHKEIDQSLQELPKNVLLAAAFTVYLAGAPEDVRKEMIQAWTSIAQLENEFNFNRIMSTESQQLVWKSEGLPSDQLSIENAIILVNSGSTSLMIDPSGQSIEWLKNTLKSKKPEVVNYCDENFMRSLELAIRFGKTLIVQEMTYIDPVLFPLLRSSLQKHGSRYLIELADKAIDFNEEFRLFMVTKKADFALPPNVVGFINDINFTITKAGLAGQLLGVTIQHEQPQLGSQKTALLEKEESLKLQLTQLEEQLLNDLANSEGNILENQSLIKSLNEAKEKSNIVQHSLAESKNLQAAIDLERNKYQEISLHGSNLYFVINDLCKLNNMYRFSLNSFLRLFIQSLKTGTISDTSEDRNQLLLARLEKLVYMYVARSLFKSDRITFALKMIHTMRPSIFEPGEWEFFCGIIIPVNEDVGSNPPEWLSSDKHVVFQKATQILPQFMASLSLNDRDIWNKWMESPNPEMFMPKERVSAFQKVLVIQLFRQDRLISALNLFACQTLGLESLAPPAHNFDQLVNESVADEPILFVTTPGTDPSAEIREYARNKVGSGKYHELSMGQGQGDVAVEIIRNASKNGEWVCLQNIHLVIGWVPTLENVLLTTNPNPNFRLFLTSESHSKFPQSLLEKCLKITIEAPPGNERLL